MSVAKARNIISENLYLTLGTVSRDMLSWVTPLFYAHNGTNFYWYSRKDADHSTNITKNKSVSAVIYDSGKVGAEVQALYIKGEAFEISNNGDLDNAMKLYVTKAFANDNVASDDFLRRPEDFLAASPLRFYQLTSHKLWILGESKAWNNKWLDYREEVDLK